MKFRHHKYTWAKPFGSVQHSWQLVGPDGGVHFTASLTPGYDPSCGLEFHHARSTGYGNGEAPGHSPCWLTGEPCWHDGTSLYASETLWPMVEAMLRSGDHGAIFRVLEGEYNNRIGEMVKALRLGASQEA